MSIVKNDLADNSLNDPHRLLRNMIDQVPDYLFVKDLDCRFIVANEAVARIHGFESPDDLTGKNDFDLHDASSAAEIIPNRTSGHSYWCCNDRDGGMRR